VNPQLLTVKQWLLARQGKAGCGKDEWGGEGRGGEEREEEGEQGRE